MYIKYLQDYRFANIIGDNDCITSDYYDMSMM
jgi:hypothetical protein